MVVQCRLPKRPGERRSRFYPRQCDGRIDAIEASMTESRWVARAVESACGQGFQLYLCSTPDGVGAEVLQLCR